MAQAALVPPIVEHGLPSSHRGTHQNEILQRIRMTLATVLAVRVVEKCPRREASTMKGLARPGAHAVLGLVITLSPRLLLRVLLLIGRTTQQANSSRVLNEFQRAIHTFPFTPEDSQDARPEELSINFRNYQYEVLLEDPLRRSWLRAQNWKASKAYHTVYPKITTEQKLVFRKIILVSTVHACSSGTVYCSSPFLVSPRLRCLRRRIQVT